MSSSVNINEEQNNFLQEFKTLLKIYNEKMLKEKCLKYSFNFEKKENGKMRISEDKERITSTRFLSRKRLEDDHQIEQGGNCVNSYKAKLREKLFSK